MSGAFDKRRAKTVVPVPIGTALHQLCSVLPAGRIFNSDDGAAAELPCSAIRDKKKSAF